MILICGGLADSVTELVCARLTDCGYPYRLLDLGTYPADYRVHWYWRNAAPEGYIATPEWVLALDDISGVFIRYLGSEARVPLAGVIPAQTPALYGEYDAGLMLLLEDLPCPVVNRMGGGMSNNSKPYQALLVQQCGLRTPRTLVTNDHRAARRFFDDCAGSVVYKSLSGIRSIVRRLEPAQLGRLSLLENGAAQFQAYVPGVNVRVHTVGDEVFATRVHSAAVDYRYANRVGETVSMEAMTLPPTVSEACTRLARALELHLTGIDLKVTPDGEYFCFEANPCPAFSYYERHTHQPISRAIADLLYRGVQPASADSHAPAML